MPQQLLSNHIKTKDMANAKPKKRAMRSKRSGVKKLELVKNNMRILQKLK
jgi:hypothetical protein